MLDPELKRQLNETDCKQQEEIKALAESGELTEESVLALQHKYTGIFRGIVLEAHILSATINS